MSDDVTSGDDVSISQKSYPSKYQKKDWEKVRIEYELGNWKSMKELAERHGMAYSSLKNKIFNDGWRKAKSALQAKVNKKIENTLVMEVEMYRKTTYERAKHYRKLIDASQNQAGNTSPEGIPLLEPTDIDAFTRSELRLHELCKSSLQIVDAKALDVTSGGKTLVPDVGQIVAALRSVDSPGLSQEDISLIVEAEVID